MREHVRRHGTRAQKLAGKIRSWGTSDASGGVLLILFTAFALAWANSSFYDSYKEVWETRLSFRAGSAFIEKSIHDWINDGLMFFFFLLVGLEIKREVLVGELSRFKVAVLPGVAALAGMALPAAVYIAFNWNEPSFKGWGVPVATDIVFAMGLLALFGRNLPRGLRVFLVSLAIVDDIGGVVVIALFYSSGISLEALAAAAAVLVLLVAGNLAGFRHPLFYYILGFFLWLAFLISGVHSVIAGVLLAATVPIRSRIDAGLFLDTGRSLLREFESACSREKTVLTNEKQQEIIEELISATELADTPLRRMEHALRPWVFLVILPAFALANAGVPLSRAFLDSMSHPVGLGIMLGLVAGKQAGILLSTLALTKTGFAVLPEKVRMSHIYAAGWLAGIGFTISFFIADLAFAGSPAARIAKEAVLAASFFSATGSIVVLKWIGLRRS